MKKWTSRVRITPCTNINRLSISCGLKMKWHFLTQDIDFLFLSDIIWGGILFVLKRKWARVCNVTRRAYPKSPQLFVEKRDGRKVKFDVDKIYRALVKATEEVAGLTPALEAKLETVTDRIVAEILERFPRGVKFTRFKMSLSMSCCKPMNMRLPRAILPIARSVIWALKGNGYQLYHRQATQQRTKLSLMKMPIRTATFLIPSAIWQQELSASLLVLKCCPNT